MTQIARDYVGENLNFKWTYGIFTTEVTLNYKNREESFLNYRVGGK